MKSRACARAWSTAILAVTVLGYEVPAKAEAGRHPIATVEEARSAVRQFIGSGPCGAAGLRVPLGRFGEADLGLALAGSTALFVNRPEGYEPRFAGFIRINATGVCTGLYPFDHRTRTFTDFGNTNTYHLPPIVVEEGKAHENETVQALKLILSRASLGRNEDTDAQRTAVARGAGVASPNPTGTLSAMGLGPVKEARTAPAARPVIQTVYREVPVEMPSRLMQLVESRLGWLLLGVLALGIVAGFATRGSGSRQIVISPEEHARAAAALEQRLRTDALRIQRLSSAVDEEEARFIQRVSAITGRS